MEKKSDIGQRRSQRLELRGINESTVELVGAQAEWKSTGLIPVYDISYVGAAIGCPMDCDFEEKQDVEIKFTLGGEKTITVTANVVRITQKMVALSFRPLSKEARLALDLFLRDKITGSALSLINPEFIKEPQDVDFWFQGPHDTNIFIWCSGEDIDRVQMEFGPLILYYQGGRWTEAERHDGFEQSKPQPITAHRVRRALHLLTQAPDADGILEKIINLLLKEK